MRSVNGPQVSIIQGYQVPGTTNGDGAVRCVYLTNGASLSGFTLTQGATRTNGTFPDEIAGGAAYCASNAVLSNCVLTGNSALYGGGACQGRLSNCRLSGNSAGSEGGGAYSSSLDNCVLTGNSATVFGGGSYYGNLIGCTLTGNSAVYGGGAAEGTLNNCALGGNSASSSGGGADMCVLYNCTLTANSAQTYGGGADISRLVNCTLRGNSAAGGGGVDYSFLTNCLLVGNWATDSGGGAYASTLFNCTLTANSATNHGGGGYGFDSFHIHANCILYNSIIYSNMAAISPDCECTQYDCCMPDSGSITSPPLFIDLAGGNLRLQSNSPCINAGNNNYVSSSTDLDGRTRIVGGTVDIGAYEFQPNTSGAFIGWLQQYGLATDGSGDYTDSDGDGRNNWQEWRCLTIPTNAASVLRMVSAVRNGANVAVTWQSVAGVNYFLERSTNLAGMPIFVTVASGIPGQTGTTTYVDSTLPAAPRLFYRVGVGP